MKTHTGAIMKWRYFLLVSLSTTLLIGCDHQPSNNEVAATTLGAVAGGVIGASFGSGSGRIAGAAVGAAVGGIVGNAIGRDMDEGDRREARNAFITASRTHVGETVYWSNVRTGNWGTYRPLRDGHRRYDGMYCREFESRANVNGRVDRVYGTACRRPNGTWEAI